MSLSRKICNPSRSMGVGKEKAQATFDTTPEEMFAAGKDKVEKTNVIVKAMTKTMVEALKIPHFGYKDEVMKMIRLIIIGVHIILDLKEEEIGRQ